MKRMILLAVALTMSDLWAQDLPLNQAPQTHAQDDFWTHPLAYDVCAGGGTWCPHFKDEKPVVYQPSVTVKYWHEVPSNPHERTIQ